MSTGMPNIDIRDFTTVSSVDGSDHVVLSLFGGAAGKMTVALFKTVVTKSIKPSIGGKGQWFIGEVDTGIMAEGKTPELRKGVTAIEYKYTTEEESAWRPLISISDLRLRYEDLTDEQKDSLRLDFDDLSEEDIAELQRPAAEMITVLERTDSEVRAAESARVDAEAGREEAERQRAEAELLRAESELWREASESQRVFSEQERVTEENERLSAERERNSSEQERISSENRRASSEQERVSSESARESSEQEREVAERQRIEAELLRVQAENERNSSESARAENENAREASENQRVSSEQDRVTAEEGRVTAETERVASEQRRQEDYENMKESLLTSQMILVMSESDYEDAVNSGTVDDTKLYFAYEEE